MSLYSPIPSLIIFLLTNKTGTAAWSVCAHTASWPASGQASAGLAGSNEEDHVSILQINLLFYNKLYHPGHQIYLHQSSAISRPGWSTP